MNNHYRLFISSYYREIKLYWNETLQEWVASPANATSYTEVEVKKPFPFKIQFEKYEEYEY